MVQEFFIANHTGSDSWEHYFGAGEDQNFKYYKAEINGNDSISCSAEANMFSTLTETEQ